MRTISMLVVLLVLGVVAQPVEAVEVTSFEQTAVGYMLAVKVGTTETRCLIRFVGSETGEVPQRGSSLYPKSGESLICQIVAEQPSSFKWRIQYALCAFPVEKDWREFAKDRSTGWHAMLGRFGTDPDGLATPLKFRIWISGGIRKEIRILGIKEPITNGILKLFGCDRKDQAEYTVLYIDPTPAPIMSTVVKPTICEVEKNWIVEVVGNRITGLGLKPANTDIEPFFWRLPADGKLVFPKPPPSGKYLVCLVGDSQNWQEVDIDGQNLKFNAQGQTEASK